MKKLTAIFAMVLVCYSVSAQLYYNEWIDYSKTYYKFKVGSDGLYRITSNQLQSIGLGNVPAQNFQLWRNGKQVIVYTSVSTGTFPATGYIEFWGQKNDGVVDHDLYRRPEYQLSDKESLLSDTAAYFLTYNTTGNNLRYTTTANNVSGNTLPPVPYFMYTAGQYFKERLHRGIAINAGGEYVYSSSFDIGEMWTTGDIYASTPDTTSFSNLYVAATGPAANVRAGMAGSAPNYRGFEIDLNNTKVIDSNLSQFGAAVLGNYNVPLSLISSNNAAFKVVNKSSNTTDRIVCNFLELTYPRQFNFGNRQNFEFTLPASASNRYLEIINLNVSGSTPVLYDITNKRRYVADISGSQFRFVILPSATADNFVLVSQDAANGNIVTGLQQRNFVNYGAGANQGDYLIITHPNLTSLYQGANQVEEYRAYRSSVMGGSFNAKIYDINELTDQFGYGIKHNPLGVKNFLRWARSTFAVQPKYCFIIGRGVTYADYRENQHEPFMDNLQLVPTWGYPASDILLASNNMDPVMNTMISRLAAITPGEVAQYLAKVKEYEQAQQNPMQTIADKAWMKNVVQVIGANDQGLEAILESYMRNYENKIEDTLFGGYVSNFNKTESGPVTPITNAHMSDLFSQGISLVNYFGHSSATSLDYNLDDPAAYNNTGKYPVFLVSGCLAGNIYSYDVSRSTLFGTLSEKWVLTPQRGAIGFIASTHFGVDTYLDFLNQHFYESVAKTGYGKSLAYNLNEAISAMVASNNMDFLMPRLHAEETCLHGDPALKMNTHALPDFVIEEPQIQVVPNIVSVADSVYNVKVKVYNIGKAMGDSVRLQIKHVYPNGSDTLIYNKRIKSVRYLDSVSVRVPIVAQRDKGPNKICVAVDTDNGYAELSETNNSNCKEYTVYEDEVTPLYPYNYSIVNKQNIKLYASTANPVVSSRQYFMEIDTTELFNSSLKVSKNLISSGGLLEFDPGLSFTDSTVYYWRVAPAASSGSLRWNKASFIYLANSSLGFNQSHYYQHQKSTGNDIYIDSASRKWTFAKHPQMMTIINSIYPTSGTEDGHFAIQIGGEFVTKSACVGHSVIFNVFEPRTMQPLYNQTVPSTIQSGTAGGFMGSGPACGTSRKYNFEFSYLDTADRRKMIDFMDWVPAGYYVTARLILDAPYQTFASNWQNDEAVYGTNNTAYSRLKAAGFADFDSFSYPRTWSFIYKKNDNAFQPQWLFSTGLYDRITMYVPVDIPATAGFISSPTFGPAQAWHSVKWRGSSLETPARDTYRVYVIGIRTTGQPDTLYTLQPNQQDFNVSSVSAAVYPYIRLAMFAQDTVAVTPYQLRYWRLLYDPLPEGALAPNISFNVKDTLDAGEPFDMKLPFKNVSDMPFADSIKVKLQLTDNNNVTTTYPQQKLKALQPGDTGIIHLPLNTAQLTGNNTLYVEVNPNNDQPELYHFNNYLYKNFIVGGDKYKPLLDVTFDGVHILNGDIVSAKPKIIVKLKDEAKFLALNDTSLAQVYVRLPGANGTLQRFAFGTDTLKFIPADLSTGKNEATIEFTPFFRNDSEDDYYELVVRGKDKSGNPAGEVEYHVRFQVFNKPMISNMFNYPNPFTSSTAFVFTLTGSEVPQNLRIQIMTITGKIVKDITKAELGPLHIGRNITEYKWDGTDQYGQKLGNGVYLYRVLTNLNGASLDKFQTRDESGEKVNTDKYFNKGYGKMYLMR